MVKHTTFMSTHHRSGLICIRCWHLQTAACGTAEHAMTVDVVPLVVAWVLASSSESCPQSSAYAWAWCSAPSPVALDRQVPRSGWIHAVVAAGSVRSVGTSACCYPHNMLPMRTSVAPTHMLHWNLLICFFTGLPHHQQYQARDIPPCPGSNNHTTGSGWQAIPLHAQLVMPTGGCAAHPSFVEFLSTCALCRANCIGMLLCPQTTWTFHMVSISCESLRVLFNCHQPDGISPRDLKSVFAGH